MNYAQQQRDPSKHLVGISLVVVLHIILVYGLLNGLARKAIEVLKDPLEVRLIQEIKPVEPLPPPPPPKIVKVTPPPAVIPPPQVYVPPPEVVVEAPQQHTVVATTVVPTPPQEAPPPPPPTPVAKVEPPAVVNVGLACPNHLEVRRNVDFPERAVRLGLSGNVLVEFVVNPDGAISNIAVIKSTNAVFNQPATAAVSKLQCVGQERSVRVQVPFGFKLET